MAARILWEYVARVRISAFRQMIFMDTPSLKELDEIRNLGFRPEAVGCFLNKKKILFLFNKEYNLWQLPQGGINNRETIEKAIIREMTEELGEEFMKPKSKIFKVIGEDQIEFPLSVQNSKDLKNDKGENIFMRGKKYFFVVIESDTTDLNIDETEFDDHRWVNFNGAVELASKIYQRGKRRVTISVLNTLKSLEFL